MKYFATLFLALSAVSCSTPPPILSATYSLTIPGNAGVSGNINLTDFASQTQGAITVLTFTNSDGDMLEFHINGLHAGNTYQMSAGSSMVGSFTILDENGASTQVQIQNTEVGYFSPSNISGSGAQITSVFAGFKVNIQIAGDGPSTNNGTIQGNVGF